MERPIDFLKRQNLDFKIEGEEIRLHKCPFCGSEGNRAFVIHAATGKWHCFACLESGRSLYSLKKKMGLIDPVAKLSSEKLKPLDSKYLEEVTLAHNTLMKNRKYLRDLIKNWKISLNTIRRQRLGVLVENEEVDGEILPVPKILIIPYFKNGRLYNIKYRSWFGLPKSFRQVKNASKIMYNEDALKDIYDTGEAILCEGEHDAITLIDKGLGNVLGIPGASVFHPEWYEKFEELEKIYLALDADKAGELGTKKLISRLGIHRCYIIHLPEGYDVSDYVNEFGIERFKLLLKEATRAEPESVHRIDKIAENEILTGEISEDVLPTFSKELNRILNGGFRPGELITAVGYSKIGKTTLFLKIATELARQNIPTMYYCVEMTATRLAKLAWGMLLDVGRDFQFTRDYVLIKHYLDENQVPSLYICAPSSIKKPEQVEETIRDSILRFGLKLVIFDNIHYLVRTEIHNRVQVMESYIRKFRDISRELEVPIVIIAHFGKGDPTTMPKGMTPQWAASFLSDSDTVLLAHRNRIPGIEESFSRVLYVSVEAGRESQGGTCFFDLDTNFLQFREITKEEAIRLEQIFESMEVKEKEKRRKK